MTYCGARLLIVFGLVFCCLGSPCRAQQDPPPPPQNPPPDAPTKPNDPAQNVPPSAGSQSDSPEAISTPPIRAINSAGPLPSGRVSAVQFGPIYLQSVDFLQTFDALSVSGQNGVAWGSFSELKAIIVFDHAFRNSHIAVQYQPRFLVNSGTVSTDASDLSAGWSTVFHLSPRLTASVSNNFDYYSRVGQFENLGLLSDLTTGGVVQSNFLEGGGHFLEDRTELGLQYLVSPRGRFEARPFFQYYESVGVTGSQVIGDSYGAGVNADYGYLLGPTKSITFNYQMEQLHYSKSIPTTMYQTIAVSYSQQLSRTWRFSAGGGAAVSSSSDPNGTTSTPVGRSTEWTENGQFTLIKSFANGSVAFSYYRGQEPGVQITNGFADRYDLSGSRQLTRRLGLNLAVGYYREFLSATNTKGFYASSGLEYELTERWSSTLQYGYKNQRNGGALFQTGDLQYVSFGIRWQPGRRPGS
jgi:hypothetical protein